MTLDVEPAKVGECVLESSFETFDDDPSQPASVDRCWWRGREGRNEEGGLRLPEHQERSM